jgi:hypothetical protein
MRPASAPVNTKIHIYRISAARRIILGDSVSAWL